MPRSCTLCSHVSRAAIEADLVRGEALRLIAVRNATTPWALLRHKKHMGTTLTVAKTERDETLGSDLLARMSELEANAHRAFARAERIASEEGQSPRVARVWISC